jgi:cold-inducible RNA-binding protein
VEAEGAAGLLEEERVSKVFVGNLSFDTTREELEALFGGIGEIAELVVPTDRDSGRPRGFAFVTFADADLAARAIEQLNGTELGGRTLRVNEATDRPERSFGGGGHSRPGGGGRFAGGPPSRPKGSRRNIRGRKRSIW